MSSCNRHAKRRILQCALGPGRNVSALRRPLIIDAFIADTSSRRYISNVELLRQRLLGYVRN